MEPDQVIENLARQLPHLKPNTISFIINYLQYYVNKCKINDTKCITKNIVNDLPSTMVEMYGKLADVVCLQYQVNSYKLFADVVDELVNLEVFNYSEGDSLDDFDIPNDFLFDVRTRLSNYIEVIDRKLNG